MQVTFGDIRLEQDFWANLVGYVVELTYVTHVDPGSDEQPTRTVDVEILGEGGDCIEVQDWDDDEQRAVEETCRLVDFARITAVHVH